MSVGEEALHSIFLWLAFEGVPPLGVKPWGAHWELSPAEAKKLDTAYKRMSRHWTPKVTEKLADHLEFARTLGVVCFPRATQSYFEARDRKAAAQPNPGQVVAPAPATVVAAGGGVSPDTGAPQVPQGPRTPSELDPVGTVIGQTQGSA